MIRYVIGGVAALFLIFVSGHLAVYIVSGLLMFAGLVALCETVPLVKFVFRWTNSLVDIGIFAFSVYGLAEMGATVAIGLSVCGLLFTVFYKPLLRRKKA